MREATIPLPQYGFVAWCSVKAQGQLYLLPYVTIKMRLQAVLVLC